MNSKLKPLLITSEQIRGLRLESVLSDTGLSLTKFAVLDRLRVAKEPMQLSRLAEYCSCVKSNITHLIDRLEAENLVKRLPDPADRRSVLAAITKAGLGRCEDAWRILKAEERRILGPLEKHEIETLLTLVDKIDTHSLQDP